MERLQLIILRGKIEALEHGLASGMLDSAWVRTEAAELILTAGMPEKERRRLELLLHMGEEPGMMQ